MEDIQVNNATFQAWRKYYKDYPMSEDVREALLNYVGNILSHKACVILDSEHLAKLLCIENESLFAIVNGTGSFYRSFEIKKKSGGMREIRAPYPSLKAIQCWIYEYVLKKQYVHGCAHGFRQRKSIVTNAKAHIENKCLLKLDLKDFFPSIKINKVVQVFKNIGYTQTVSWILAKLCCLDDELPQGAPTSPVLSNIIAKMMDKRLYRLAKSYGYKYSRYADDISFSGDEIPVVFIKYVTDIITDCGFAINPKKVRLYKEHDNKILTGVALKNGVIKLPREKRRSYEQEIYYAIKYGVSTRVKGEYKHFSTYILSLIGKANFWLMLEPDNRFAKEAIPQLKKLFNNAIGMKNRAESFTSSLISFAVDSYKNKKNWGVPVGNDDIPFERSRMISVNADLTIAEEIDIPTNEIEKLAAVLINGLNRNLIDDYTNKLESLPHDNIEINIFDLGKTHFGFNTPLMYIYLYGGVLQENMLPKLFRKERVEFDDSVIWALPQYFDVSFNVSKLPEMSNGMRRIRDLNLYYKYDKKKLTLGTYVGYADYAIRDAMLRARKIKVKFE